MEENDYYTREKGHPPVKNKCNSNLVDDGINCVDNITCIRVPCDDPKGCVKCLDPKKIPFEERLFCSNDEEKINNMCYKKCKTGYIGDETKCYKGIDSSLIKKLTNLDNESKEIDDKLEKDDFNLFIFIIKSLNWVIKKIRNMYSSLGTYRFYIVLFLVVLIYYYFFMRKSQIINRTLDNRFSGNCNNGLDDNIMRQLLSDIDTEVHMNKQIEFVVLR